MLVFDHIKFAYPGENAYALNDVSLSVSPGEHVVLLGANGSGKSTLAKLSNGMLLPSRGVVSVNGIPTTSHERIRELRTTLGVVAQDPESQIVSSSVVDEVAFGPENLGLPREEIARHVYAAIEAVGLSGKEAREPHTMSGGEKQRLVIAGILAMQPQYIVFDEPSSMLDGKGRAEVQAVIADLHRAGKGILHITHDLTECVSADRVVVISKGVLVFEGTPDELFAHETIFFDEGLSLSPMLVLAARLRSGGVALPQNSVHPALLANAVARFSKAGGACH